MTAPDGSVRARTDPRPSASGTAWMLPVRSVSFANPFAFPHVLPHVVPRVGPATNPLHGRDSSWLIGLVIRERAGATRHQVGHRLRPLNPGSSALSAERCVPACEKGRDAANYPCHRRGGFEIKNSGVSTGIKLSIYPLLSRQR